MLYYIMLCTHANMYVHMYVLLYVRLFIYIYIYIYEFGCKPPMFVCHLHGRNRKRINHEILVSVSDKDKRHMCFVVCKWLLQNWTICWEDFCRSLSAADHNLDF